MKNKYIRFLILASLIGLSLSCSKDYYDTKTAGEDYLEANAKSDTVAVLPSGIQYKVFYTNPYGIYPQFAEASSIAISVRYSIRFIDGTVYQKENTDFTSFSISSTTESMWSVIIPKMRVGSKWRVWVPYDYAFKTDGLNKKEDGSYTIDPYTVLIYDIELLNAY